MKPPTADMPQKLVETPYAVRVCGDSDISPERRANAARLFGPQSPRLLQALFWQVAKAWRASLQTAVRVPALMTDRGKSREQEKTESAQKQVQQTSTSYIS